MTNIELKVRLLQGELIAMGPGKADLLEAIADTGSISAAGRTLGMSYRRAWQLVDVMNRCFNEPLVRSAAGGQQGGGAHVTQTGFAVLAHYRAMQAAAQHAVAQQGAALAALMRDAGTPPAADGTNDRADID